MQRKEAKLSEGVGYGKKGLSSVRWREVRWRKKDEEEEKVEEEIKKMFGG